MPEHPHGTILSATRRKANSFLEKLFLRLFAQNRLDKPMYTPIILEVSTGLAGTIESIEGKMKDSRFYDGYTWCSQSADCRLGLCIPGNPEQASQLYAAQYARGYWSNGKTIIVYTLESADSQPVKWEIKIEKKTA